ncbi:MAG: leucine-rich repeat domain-containing protein [Clostridiales bacterium]|nr:leucine-rich repeat domain-containing protein [Clostridiales bacterium]
MKKWMLPVLILLLSICCLPAQADTVDAAGLYRYEVMADGTARILGYLGEEEHCVIPATLDGYKVTVIGEEAFELLYPNYLVSVSIPYGVTSIEDYAFAHNSKLTLISIPNSVHTIKSGVFSGCESLQEIVLPNTLSTIEDFAFDNCYSLRSVSIPDTVTSIGEFAFASCTSLQQIQLPKRLESVGSYAFSDCEGISYIALPDSLQKIGENPFRRCYQLSGIGISSSHSVFSVKNGALINKATNTLITYMLGAATESFQVPQGIKHLGSAAFLSCTTLKYITLPDGIKTISYVCFFNCSNLEGISLPESIEYIDMGAFANCTSLSYVTFPEKKITFDENAFANCDQLISIHIPDGVTEIPGWLFHHCDNLEEIVLPNSIEKIGDCAFAGCSKLNAIRLPKSISHIGSLSFDTESSKQYDLFEGFFENFIATTTPTDIILYVYEDSYADAYGEMNNIERAYLCQHDSGVWHTVSSYVRQEYENVDTPELHIRKDVPVTVLECMDCGFIREETASAALHQVPHLYGDDGFCMDCGFMGPLAAQARYSLYVDSPYYYSEHHMLLLKEGISAYFHVYDHVAGKAVAAGSVPHLDIRPLENEPYATMDAHHIFRVDQMFSGTYNIVLTYGGTEIDRIQVVCSGYDEDVGATRTLRLDTLATYNWNKEGMWIAPQLKMFEFKAKQQGNAYKVTAEIYNTSPALFGLAVYDAQNQQTDFVYITPYWSEFSVWGVGEYVWLGFRDFWDFKAGNTESYAKKTVIDVYVPAGGYLAFVEPMETEEMITANRINALLSILSVGESWESLVNVTEISDKAAAADAIKNLDWGKVMHSIVPDYIQQTTEEFRKEAMISLVESNWEKMTEDEMLLGALADAIAGAVIETGVNELVDYGMLATSLATYYAVHGIDALGQGIQLDKLQKRMIQSYKGEEVILCKYLFMPIAP